MVSRFVFIKRKTAARYLVRLYDQAFSGSSGFIHACLPVARARRGRVAVSSRLLFLKKKNALTYVLGTNVRRMKGDEGGRKIKRCKVLGILLSST